MTETRRCALRGQSPRERAVPRARCPEVLEVEGQDRQVVALGDGHHGCIDKAEVEIGEARIDLCGTAKKSRRQEHGGVLPARDRAQKHLRRVRRDPRAQQLIDLDEHHIGNEEVAAQFRHERGGERMRPVATIRGGHERPGVGDDSQRASTSSRR